MGWGRGEIDLLEVCSYDRLKGLIIACEGWDGRRELLLESIPIGPIMSFLARRREERKTRRIEG